ncbi:MAG: hypothetical protein KJ964_03870 [Verrucomicrobia bacterium]|nr:hypothetical protein [Verrucomicrobiota bacterium]MBU1736377.1 hypothetical protein [Verrucomicrobiota bacterium]MBU1857594.1 hypothetical protein [Verrucomicrobiota bacterium]
MGGQACVFYGAAEFSRDTDIVISLSPTNLRRLRGALRQLRAEPIAVPPLSRQWLRKGHAVHFRCHLAETDGLRLDIMAILRGVAPFETLWRRRTTIVTTDGERHDLLAPNDLVTAKKTQRDKDWPMIRRLVEAHYQQFQHAPSPGRIRFWLLESRTPERLVTLAADYPRQAAQASRKRTLLQMARQGQEDNLTKALQEEEFAERARDAAYWRPLRQELEALRHRRLIQG